jgi:hypothetical protein
VQDATVRDSARTSALLFLTLHLPPSNTTVTVNFLEQAAGLSVQFTRVPKPCHAAYCKSEGAFMDTNGSQITESAQRNTKLPVRRKHRYLAGVVLNCVSKLTLEAECAKTSF